MRTTGEILDGYMRRKMSQVELGRIVNVSPQYISNIINNLKKPSDKFLEKFYAIFDVSEEDRKMIEEYENYRKLPLKIREEMEFLKKSNDFLQNYGGNISEVPLIGEILSNNEIYYYEKKKNLLFPKIGSDDDSSLFSLLIKCGKYSPKFEEGDILIFSGKGTLDLSEIDGKCCLIDYETEKYLKDAEYIKGNIIFRSVGKRKDTLLFLKEEAYKVNIAGILKGCFSTQDKNSI